jgi:hypothetical protein
MPAAQIGKKKYNVALCPISNGDGSEARKIREAVSAMIKRSAAALAPKMAKC